MKACSHTVRENRDRAHTPRSSDRCKAMHTEWGKLRFWELSLFLSPMENPVVRLCSIRKYFSTESKLKLIYEDSGDIKGKQLPFNPHSSITGTFWYNFLSFFIPNGQFLKQERKRNNGLVYIKLKGILTISVSSLGLGNFDVIVLSA